VNFELKRVDVWSVVKIVFFLDAVIGLLVGFFYTFVFSLIGGFLSGERALPMMGFFSGVVGFFMSFVLAIFYAVLGAVFTAILAGLYNLLAGWLGGFKLSLAEEIRPEASPPPELPSREEPA